MRLLGAALSDWGVPFISAKARHSCDDCQGEVVCETQEQCATIASRTSQEGWSITTRVATADELLEARRWDAPLLFQLWRFVRS